MDNEEHEHLDEYGNNINDDEFIYCTFPNCGCNGARLCMAKNGSNSPSNAFNIESRRAPRRPLTDDEWSKA